MKILSLKENPLLPAFLLSVFFFIISLITVSWVNLPWLDEVMFADTSINFSQGLGWTTKAWYSSVGAAPVSTYPPLYQLVLSGWVRLFGISLLSVRGLTISLSFVLSIISIHFLYKNNFVTKRFHLLLFTCIYWSADTFSWICRSSRVDFFNLFCVVIFFYCVFYYTKKHKSYYYVILSGIIAVLSGVQTVPYILFILIWFIVFLKAERKKLVRSTFFFCISLLVSLLLLFIFFNSIHALVPFLVSIFSYSVTLRKIGLPLLPYVGPWFGISPDKFIATATKLNDSAFFERILKGYLLNKDALLLIAVSSIGMVAFKKSVTKVQGAWILIGFGIITPILMNISGRYEYYYTWMAFFPLLLGTTILFSGIDNKYLNYLFILSTIVLLYTGLPEKILSTQKDRYRQLENFMGSIGNDLKNDTIATCFSTYYFSRKLTKEVYAIGIYPLERVPDNINVLLDDPNDTYSHASFLHLIERESAKGINFRLIDSLPLPKLYYYRKELNH